MLLGHEIDCHTICQSVQMFKIINQQNGIGIDNQNWHWKENKALSWVNLEQVGR